MSDYLKDLIENYSYSSLQSKGVNQSDIPIPNDVESAFQYNYFVADETITRDVTVKGDSLNSFITLSDDADESARLTALVEYDVPRFNRITWTPTVLESSLVDEGSEAESSIGVTIADNLESVIYEEVMTSNQYSGIGVQDADGLGKLADMAKVAIGTSDLPFEFATSQTSTVNTDSNLDVINGYLDAVGEGSSVDKNTKETLRNALTSYQSQGDLSFINQAEDRQSAINDTLSDTATTFDMGISISNVLASSCAHAWTQDGGSTFYEEFSSIKSLLESITQQSIADDGLGTVSDNDYDISGTPVTYRGTENLASQTSGDQYVAQVAGYIIEKQEIDPSGTVTELPPLVVESSIASELIDPNVMYGKAYRYRVRTVAYLEFSAINVYPGNESRSETMVVGVFIASRASQATTALCTERIPPAPPVDIDFVYNGVKGSLDISWGFPLNRQRDIKQFRVFRRLSTGSPFSLIKNYFFDDSATLTKTTEIPNPDTLVQSTPAKLSGALIQVVSSPTTLFSDKDFDTNSSFIYALTSVDARGLSSNYSSQFLVSYDKFKARLNVTYLSRSGAPIPYPNMYLRRDLFVDTIKTSGFDQMTIYFDPEYLSVSNSDESSLDVLSDSDDEPSYKMSMINLDNQKSKMIDIFVKDIRTDDLYEVGEGVEYEVTTKVATLIDTSG